jgi:hypothetical protein
MALYVPGTEETDPKKIIMSQQLVAGQTTTNTTAIATNTADIATNTAAIAVLNAATYVNSINSRTGVITLNSTSGITNSSNDIILSQASASQFGAVKVDGTTITASGGVISAVSQTLSKANNSLGSNTAIASGSYTDGPSCAQGTSGTWFASGTITVKFTGNCILAVKLWDGTTVISSARLLGTATAFQDTWTLALSGYITSPAGNIRISANGSAANATFQFNDSGNSKDCTISAIRIG